jgi:hypothetical protein
LNKGGNTYYTNSEINNIDNYDKNEWVNLRISYANKLFWLLACEIVGLFILIILIGLQYLTIADSTLNVTIITIMLQTFFLGKRDSDESV